jgi:hypothetical protein
MASRHGAPRRRRSGDPQATPAPELLERDFSSEEPGARQEHRGYVVCGTLGYSRASAGALVFSREAPDVLWGIQRCLWRLGGLPRRLVWDREGCLHAGLGRPTDA